MYRKNYIFKMKKILFITLLILSQFLVAQDKGTLKGLLTDKETNNEPLPFANIIIKGTKIGTTSDFDGNYQLKVPAGNHVVIFSFLGYKAVEKSIIITAGQTTTINQLMSAEEGVALDDIIITATTSKEKASALILEQKKAVSIKTSIGAQELSIKGVSDAEGAVTKTAGVSKGSKNVIVRGLGDRYNSTTLNGLPLPSEDPEYKNISLDFFDTSVFKNIGINKVFTSDLYGDVGGANIDIVSKELIKSSVLDVSASLGANTQTVSKDFLTIDGTNKFGTQNSGIPVNDLTQYSFNNSWKPESQNFQMNNSVSFAGGKKFDIKDDTFSFFIVGGFDGSFNYLDGNIKQTTSSGEVFQDQDYTKYEYNVSQILMANLKYKFDEGHSIAYNHLFIHNNKQSIGDYLGFNNPEQDGDLEFQRRQQTNNNELYVNQFIANYEFTDRLNFEAKGSLNFIRGNEPDRRTNKYLLRDNFYSPQTSSAGENERYFSKLEENDYAAKGKFEYKLKEDEDDISVLEFGGDYRYTERLFSATIFNHDFSSRVAIDLENPDAIFNQNSIDTNIFELETGRGSASNPAAFLPFTYRGKRQIFAAFGNLVYQLNDNLIASFGGRFEKIQQRVTYNTNIAQSAVDGASTLDRTYVLPSFNVKYNFNDNSIFRIAGSQSYTFPQFKETAPFKYQDISFSSQGNPDLKPSDNYNLDAKYEYYLSSSELFTVTGFYKNIQNSIARTEIPSGGNTLTYLNVGNASVYGLEIEARKSIYEIEDKDVKIMAGLNSSILMSNVDLDQSSIAQFTNTTSNLEGATPFLLNADISINKKYNDNTLISSVVFNYFSERVYSIGTRGFDNILEKGIPTLDFVSSYDFNNHYSIKLKATNLLNPDFQLTRAGFNGGEDVVLRNYKRGVNLSLGFSYSF